METEKRTVQPESHPQLQTHRAKGSAAPMAELTQKLGAPYEEERVYQSLAT